MRDKDSVSMAGEGLYHLSELDVRLRTVVEP